jgi:putative iron-dependent peroxidase
VRGRGPGLDGSSFVAVQQWIHDFDKFESMTSGEQDDSIGRRKSDNVELEEAPPAAHVKRTAQESFDPAAFVLRRSMPWADQQRAGLVFVSFGKSFDAFEAQLKRMEGIEDGISDALFKFTRPVSGSYFWCPPLKNERLDLSALSL